LRTYATLPIEAATALVRAARQYQLGLWIAEVDPELAWLRFVGAIETAALFEKASDTSPVGELEVALPSLAEAIRERSVDLLEVVAEALRGRLGSTKRFVEFVMRFEPGPPNDRPTNVRAQVDWGDLRRQVAKVYDWRSLALHTGRPIPAPMLAPPGRYPGGPGRDERIWALAEGTGAAMWKREDIPMRLHVFEHITRGSLQRWWDSLAEGAVSNGRRSR
jgi:hypothetical protein